MKQLRQHYAGKVFNVESRRVELTAGHTGEFDIVRHPGGAAVLPILPDGRLLLIRQLRPAVDASLVEIPAGRLEPGEEPLACAARELEEETGWRGQKLTPLGMVYSTPGFCDEAIHLFLAEELLPGRLNRDADEEIELLPVSLDEALELLRRGGIPDAKTAVALLRYVINLQAAEPAATEME